MREDPVARRNRGASPAGLWFLLGLSALAVILVVAVLLRPKPAAAPMAPEPAAVSMAERVAADERSHRRRDAARAEAKVAAP